jgi:hypothetical protein
MTTTLASAAPKIPPRRSSHQKTIVKLPQRVHHHPAPTTTRTAARLETALQRFSHPPNITRPALRVHRRRETSRVEAEAE